MKSAETADRVIDAIREGKHPFIRANFAAGDMVGHSGVLQAAVIAVEAVDLSVGRVLPVVMESGGTLVVTADHGNSEDMVDRDSQGRPQLDEQGRPKSKTSHSLSPVEFFVLDGAGRDIAFREDLPEAGLANVAATLTELLGYEPPELYEPSLLDGGER
jgi:2,3-bisphosphoglycerate-independent phosphoglycerate mutase